MKSTIFLHSVEGGLTEWARKPFRDLRLLGRVCDEKLLEDLIAERPELLGAAITDGDADPPFVTFSQRALRAHNGRPVFPDLVLFSANGYVVIVEVKLGDNPELRDRAVVAQVLEYASCLSATSEEDLLALFTNAATPAGSWPELVQQWFPMVQDPTRIADRFLRRFRDRDLQLVIATDEVPRGLRELVRGVIAQAAIGDYKFQVVEVGVFAPPSLDRAMLVPEVRVDTEVVSRTTVTLRHETGAAPQLSVSVTSLDEAIAEKAQAEARAASPKWDETSFFEDADRSLGARAEVLRAVYARVNEHGFFVRWAGGSSAGALHVLVPQLSSKRVVAFYSNGELYLLFRYVDPDVASRLRADLREIGLQFGDANEPLVKFESWAPRWNALLDVLARER